MVDEIHKSSKRCLLNSMWLSWMHKQELIKRNLGLSNITTNDFTQNGMEP